jgi:hypothetical protein
VARSSLLIAAALAATLSAPAAAAPPPVGSEDYQVMMPYKEWITSQHDGLGRWCCDIGDGRPVEAVIGKMAPGPVREGEWRLPGPAPVSPAADGDDHWWAHVTPAHWPGEIDRWVFVPDEKITHNANPTGSPILWLYQGRVQCFAPPDGV